MDYQAKACVVIRRPSSGNNMTRFVLNLPESPKDDCSLTVNGMDDDKPGRPSLEIQVNNKTIFNGANAFKEGQWSSVNLPISAGTLRMGKNEIAFINQPPDGDDGEVTSEVAIEAAGRKRHNYSWGWLAIAEVKVLGGTAGE